MEANRGWTIVGIPQIIEGDPGKLKSRNLISVSEKQLKDFAKTKRKRLPKKRPLKKGDLLHADIR